MSFYRSDYQECNTEDQPLRMLTLRYLFFSVRNTDTTRCAGKGAENGSPKSPEDTPLSFSSKHRRNISKPYLLQNRTESKKSSKHIRVHRIVLEKNS